MALPLVNGREFSYVQIIVNILGVPVTGITALTYEEDQVKENQYGTGNRPVSVGDGPITTSGSIEILMSDTEALRAVAPNRSLLQLPAFDIPVTFGNPGNVQTHVIKNVEFTKDGVNATQGDTGLKMTHDINFSHINYNG